MHSKHIDLARTAACYRDEPQHDRRHVSILWWCIPTFAAWVALIAMVAF
jgi:hypothetical protein